VDTCQIAGPGRDLGKNFIRLSTSVPVDVVQRQCTNLILSSLIIAPRLGIQELDLRHSQYTLFNLPYQSVLFFRRQIATGADINHSEWLLDIWKVLNALAEKTERQVDRKQQGRYSRDTQPRARQPATKDANVAASNTSNAVEVARFRRCQIASGLFRISAGPAKYRTQSRHEKQRHYQRCRKYGDQCYGQVLHEFTRRSRPKREWDKRGECRAGGCNDWPGHANRRPGICIVS